MILPMASAHLNLAMSVSACWYNVHEQCRRGALDSLHRSLADTQVDKSLKSVTHGQCDKTQTFDYLPSCSRNIRRILVTAVNAPLRLEAKTIVKI